MVDALDHEVAAAQAQGLVHPAVPVVYPEREIDERHVETHETDHRPSADQEEAQPGAEADRPNRAHQDQEVARAQAPVRGQERVEEQVFGRLGVAMRNRIIHDLWNDNRACNAVP